MKIHRGLSSSEIRNDIFLTADYSCRVGVASEQLKNDLLLLSSPSPGLLKKTSGFMFFQGKKKEKEGDDEEEVGHRSRSAS